MSALHTGRAIRSLPRRLGSSLVIGLTGIVARSFLYGLNHVETTGLEKFLKLLDDRSSGQHGQGLLTVSNHISVLDDPVMWGVLPMRHIFNTGSIRWSLGAHDICFRNNLASRFFSLGQVLPTHRSLHSPHGGLFQPTMAEAIHALSGQTPSPPSKTTGLTFTTTQGETFPSPSAYTSKAWVHIFPEACVHQHPELALRYFKWGVSRLVLETNPAPKLVPIFISGFQDIMHETRGTPRWMPRVGAKIKLVFGDPIDTGELFKESRQRWRMLVESSCPAEPSCGDNGYPGSLQSGDEAVRLRVAVAAAVRDEIVQLRMAAGYADDEPALALAKTWEADPAKKKYKSPVDGSLVHRE